MRPYLPLALIAPACCLFLAGCEQLGIEDPAKIQAMREADGRAIGGACRHSGRALEDCYKLNAKASKAAIYAGWRDMDAYMRENNIAVVPTGASKVPVGEPAPAEPAAKASAAQGPGEPRPGEPVQSAGRKST